jgi:hypothetical protein
MAAGKRNLFSRIGHFASLILRPRYSLNRLKEILRERGRTEVKSSIPLDELPPVEILPVRGDRDLEERLVKVYYDNPSTLVSGPMDLDTLREKQSKNFEFFLVLDRDGNDAGAIAFDNDRAMSCHLVTDFRYRSMGLGLSAMLELEAVKIKEGIYTFWGQVYKDNPRMLSLVLSMGFVIVEEKSTPEYYTIRKDIPSLGRN